MKTLTRVAFRYFSQFCFFTSVNTYFLLYSTLLLFFRRLTSFANILFIVFFSPPRCQISERMPPAAQDPDLPASRRLFRSAQTHVHAVETGAISAIREVGRDLRHGRGQR